ncbi:hypothetical protein ABK040_011068 [Willaertia magna]
MECSYRVSEFKTIAKTETKTGNNKKGLFIYSQEQIFVLMEEEQEENKLSFFVSGISFNWYSGIYTVNSPFLSQLDVIDCNLLDKNENTLINYDILFIGEYVTFSNKMLKELTEMIESKKISIVFLTSNFSDSLVTQLNFVKKDKYFVTNAYEFKLISNTLTELSKDSFILREFITNNKIESKENGLIEVENIGYNFRVFLKNSIVNLNDWHILAKCEGGYSELIHRNYKILITHWGAGYSPGSQFSFDLFYYLVKYLLFEHKENDGYNRFKELLVCSGSSKLSDISFFVKEFN